MTWCRGDFCPETTIQIILYMGLIIALLIATYFLVLFLLGVQRVSKKSAIGVLLISLHDKLNFIFGKVKDKELSQNRKRMFMSYGITGLLSFLYVLVRISGL